MGTVAEISQVGSIVQRTLFAAWLRVSNALPGGSSSKKAQTCPVRDKDEIVQHCLTEDALTTSAQAVSRLVAGHPTQPSTVRQLLLQTGAAVQEMGSWMCGLLFSKIQNLCEAGRCYKPIAYVVAMRYDETPHAVRIASTLEGQLFLGRTALSSETQADRLQACGVETSMVNIVQNATHAKIMQVEHKVASLVQHRQTKEFMWTSTDVPSGLSAVDRSTGETTRAVLWNHISSLPEVQRLWSPYPLRIRVSTADRAGSNQRAEIGLQEPEFMPEFIKAPFPCDVHKVATCMKSSLSLASDDITGVLNVGLLTTEAGSTRMLRAILIEIFSELSIVHSNAPVGEKNREEVLDMFVPVVNVPPPRRKLNQKRRYILKKFLNADWAEPKVQHICQYGCCVSEADTRKAFAFYVSWAIIPHSCPVFSRKSWTRADEALDWAGLLCHCHNLMERVVTLYVGSPSSTVAAPAPTSATAAGEDAWEAALLADVARPSSGQAAVADDALLQAAADGGDEEGGAAAAERPPANSTEQWQAFRRQKRKLVQMWSQSHPGPRLAVAKRTLQPTLRFLANMLKMSGAAWELKQQRRAVNTGDRSYVVLEAARGDNLKACMDELYKILHEDLLAVPHADVCAELRSLRFRMTSCVMCALHALIRLAHSSMPVQLFQALDGQEDLVAQWPKCLRDELSAAVLQRYPDPGSLCSDECQILLQGLASLLPLDIAALECRHAKNREHTLLRSRGWTPSLETISAKHLCSFSNAGKPARSGKRRVLEHEELAEERKPKKGGGAWRAFIHEECERAGKSLRHLGITDLAEKYNNLPDSVSGLQLHTEASTPFWALGPRP